MGVNYQVAGRLKEVLDSLTIMAPGIGFLDEETLVPLFLLHWGEMLFFYNYD